MTTIANQGCGSEAGAALCAGIVVRFLLLGFICTLLAPGPGYSEELRLQSFSLRARISGATMLGEQQPEEFQEFDAAANFGLPWARYAVSGWGGGTRLMVSAGLMRGGGENALIVSLIPGLTFGSEDGRFTLDMGAGGALISQPQFDTQDYGGPFQFALTVGLGFPLYKQLGFGYRFLHYSDAGLNGPDTIGADFHMIEFSYRL